MSTAVEPHTKRLTDRHHLFISRIITNGGNAADAAEFAGFAKPYDRSGWRLLQRVDIRRAIEDRQQANRIQADYSISDWRRDLMADIARAAEAGSHSAVMKGRELLGRHIGALNDRASFGAEELKAFAWLGAAMQKLEDSSSGSPLHEVEGLPARELADSQPASMQDS